MTETSFFLDTNVLIRLIADDDEHYSELARRLIIALEQGSIAADISDTVIFECVYVMNKQYGMTRSFVIEALASILGLESVRTSSKAALLSALELWGRIGRISFADAYHLVLTAGSAHERIATFDKGMGNVLSGVTRIEQLP